MRYLTPLLSALALGACASQTQQPAQSPATPAPMPPAAKVDWRDLAETPGRWRYAQEPAGSRADFLGADNAVALTIRCQRADRIVAITRSGAAAGPMVIETSYAPRTINGSGQPIAARLPASDQFLDKIAFSRGRVSIAAPRVPLLVVPAWAEPARVIEDCRG